MPTYISLMAYTDDGIQAVRQSPRRLDAAKKMLEGTDVTSVRSARGALAQQRGTGA